MPVCRCFTRPGVLGGAVLVTGQPEEGLLISLRENPAANAVEGGSIFPALGQDRQ